MKGSKLVKLRLDSFGSHLGMEKGCFVLRDKSGETKRYPVLESQLGEVVLQSGNTISVGALVYLSCWNVDTLIVSGSGKPVGMLRNLFDDSNIATKVAQFKALENEKGLHVAKQIVLKKLESQNVFLRKHGLRQHDIIRVKDFVEHLEETNLKALRRKLLPVEGRCTNAYFAQMFQLFANDIRTSNNRKTFHAFDALNNNMNLVYSLLKWKTHSAIVRAKMEPFLGFLHSEQFGKPSLVCDVMEFYRSLADDFLVEYSKGIKRKDFVVKKEQYVRNKAGKREFLNDTKTKEMTKAFYSFMERQVSIPRIKVGNRQSLETLISEECLLLAKYLRGEKTHWEPRIAELR